MREKLRERDRSLYGRDAIIWALLFGVPAAGACGSEFDNCADTRTCPIQAEGGAAGASDSASAAAGEATSPGGNLTDFAGQANGLGGAAPSNFDIIATNPVNAASAVERDAAIELTFSTGVDPASVTNATVKIVGPSGPLSGNLKVVGSTVTFTPASPLALLADYQVDVAAKVAASDGRQQLGVARHFQFQSRDGAFRKPERLTSDKVVNLGLKGAHSGYAIAYWTDGKNPASPFASTFDPTARSWSKAHSLESDAVKDYSVIRACLNDAGEAFASIGGVGFGAWARWSSGAWAAPNPSGVAQARDCALAADGTVMTSWEDTVNATWTDFAASLSAAGQWSATKTLQTKARTWGVFPYNGGFLALHSREPSGQVFSQVYDSKGWAIAVPVTPPAVSAGYVSYATFADSALFTWTNPMSRVQGSIFDGATWTSTELGPATGGSTSESGGGGYVAMWINLGSAFAARYDAVQGWLDPVKLGATSAEDYGPGAALDDANNALAIWPEGSKVTWRRCPHTTLGWLEAQSFENEDPSALFAVGAATGEVLVVWQNPLGVWATRFE